MSKHYSVTPTTFNGVGQANGHSGRPESKPSRPSLVRPSEMTEVGSVKWFDSNRSYGFVILKEGGEAFLHKSVVTKYGLKLRELLPDTPVRLLTSESRSGRPEVTAIALI